MKEEIMQENEEFKHKLQEIKDDAEKYQGILMFANACVWVYVSVCVCVCVCVCVRVDILFVCEFSLFFVFTLPGGQLKDFLDPGGNRFGNYLEIP